MAEKGIGLGKAMHLEEDVYYYVRKTAIEEDTSVAKVANQIIREYYKTNNPKRDVSVTIDEMLMEDINALAESKGITLGELIEEKLAQAIRKNNKVSGMLNAKKTKEKDIEEVASDN